VSKWVREEKARLQMGVTRHNQKEYPAAAGGLESVKKTPQVAELGKGSLALFSAAWTFEIAARFNQTRICH
jgi:hypothetical protein